MVRQVGQSFSNDCIMLGSSGTKLVLLQQPLNRCCKLGEGRHKQPETGQKAVYVLHIPNGLRSTVDLRGDRVQGVLRPAGLAAAFAFANYALYFRHEFCRNTSNNTLSAIP